MQNKQHILSLAITLVILFIFFIGLTNTLINSYVSDLGIFKGRRENVIAIPQETVKTVSQEPKNNTLISEDPARYNIQVFTDRDLRLSQAQWDVGIWDVNMKKALLHSNAAGHMDRGGKTPKELKERLGRINRQIKDLEKTDRKSTGNQTEEMKLQSLYILKSSLTVLGEQTGEKIPERK
ncbi:MAG TPA: hypothetical protein DE315_05900 [Candidatus Omnitrophica bacterium]|nr:hypothetical protein [Candidatus Omnitrophota bacterium]HCI45042.1 hypothetical protein [Candidatus Omnitrophota bacterium]